MSNIRNMQELREEIKRVKMESDFCKSEIRNSYNNFKRSLTPLNLLLSILGELKQDTLFKAAITAFEKIKEYFTKK